MKFLDVLIQTTAGGQLVLKPTGNIWTNTAPALQNLVTCNCYFKELFIQFIPNKSPYKLGIN